MAMRTSHPRSISRNCCAAGRRRHHDGSNARLIGELAGLLVNLNGEFARGGDDEREGVRLAPAAVASLQASREDAVDDGKQNAAVLPEPVCAHAIRSRPASEMGMAYFCTGVGFLNLHLSMFLFTAEPKSMSWNVLMGSGMFSPGRLHRNVLVRVEIDPGGLAKHGSVAAFAAAGHVDGTGRAVHVSGELILRLLLGEGILLAVVARRTPPAAAIVPPAVAAPAAIAAIVPATAEATAVIA